MTTPEERAANVVRRCWAESYKLRENGEENFKGLDVEIAAAIRAALDERTEECARIAENLDPGTGDGNGIAAAIRSLKTKAPKE